MKLTSTKQGRKHKNTKRPASLPTRSVFHPVGFSLTLLLLAGILYWNIFTPSAHWVEQNYSRWLYPRIAKNLISLTDGLPFSVASILVITIPLLLLVVIIISWQRSKKRKLSPWTWLGRWLLRLFSLAVFIYALFILFWGANYQRESIEIQFSLSGDVTQAEVEALAQHLTVLINQHSDAVLDTSYDIDMAAIYVQQMVARATGITPPLPSRLKQTTPGALYLLGNAVGVVSPLTLEAHVDGALPNAAYLAVGAHELAHVAGYAGEADADFMAALAGLNALKAPYLRYATALRLWRQATWQLPEDIQSELYRDLPQRAKDDLDAMRETSEKYNFPWLNNLQSRIYDRYLKNQGVSEGIRDYSRTIQLLAKAQKQGLVLTGE